MHFLEAFKRIQKALEQDFRRTCKGQLSSARAIQEKLRFVRLSFVRLRH